MKKLIIPITFILMISLAIGAQPGVSIHKLNNGMDVLLIENKALPMVGVNVIIKTGSAYETYETSGMSHMLEHLLFNGTTTRTQRELYDATDLIGGYNNANTGDYYTNFMMVMPEEHKIAGMEIQADMLFNSILPEEKFEKEKGIVLEEIAQSLSKPATQMEYNLSAELYEGHSLSLPTLGTYATIEHMTRDAVNHYYTSTYRPNNMILSAIGNFDSATMLDDIKRIYGVAAPGSIFRPTDSILKTGMIQPVATPMSETSWLDRYYGGEVPTLHQIYTLENEQPQGFLQLLEMALKDHQSRIETELKEAWPESVDGLSMQIHTSPIANYVELKLNLKNENNARAISKQLKKVINKTKFKIASTTLASMATKEKTAFLQNVEKPHMFGIYNAFDLAVSGIDGVLDLSTASDFSKAATALKYFRLNMEPSVIFHHAQSAESAGASGEIKTSLVQSPEKGMGLIVRQNPGSELLAIHYLFKYKSAHEVEFGKEAAKYLHDCFGQRMKSTEKLAQSQKFGLKFTVNDNPWIPMDNIYLHPDFGYIRVEGLANDLPGTIAFLNTEMNSFIPTAEEFKIAQGKFSQSMMHGGKDKAKDLFDALVDSTLYGSTVKENDKALTYESLVKFARVYFTPENRLVSVVSPKSEEMVSKLLLAGAKSPAKTYPLTDKSYLKLDTPVYVDVPGGGERTYLFWGFVKNIDRGDEAALKALGLILSDKIIFDVREKQGLAYRMTATSAVRDDKALFYISLGTRPQNAEVLLPQFESLMSRQTLGELSEEDVQKTINMYLGRMMFRRLSSINQAYYLGTSLFFENEMNHDKAFLDALKAVTLEDVNRVADKYLSAENAISIVVR
ncbi:MAG: insulinase family protein [Candidatus Marinimicrobia bacterium]|jgi:predicted Zn-dependent peptidase|nr:insulinase family protein [Candidatus Neomarinimicrobiota bacterium]MBT3680993.1 insulinase family protein [Candidatus Neomarinimicrobiota bacterium]MBT3952126.1 insulinase family protein [Candidatus Neomarinimicrobiota bacterium]MBT4254324.1 insulinase family protein [Candidatus Neomarinimicrobiota bacterium]MBT4479505.1 insulinase family protein [Candidatus Neomarinimicrobiota bacterium]